MWSHCRLRLNGKMTLCEPLHFRIRCWVTMTSMPLHVIQSFTSTNPVHKSVEISARINTGISPMFTFSWTTPKVHRLVLLAALYMFLLYFILGRWTSLYSMVRLMMEVEESLPIIASKNFLLTSRVTIKGADGVLWKSGIVSYHQSLFLRISLFNDWINFVECVHIGSIVEDGFDCSSGGNSLEMIA